MAKRRRHGTTGKKTRKANTGKEEEETVFSSTHNEKVISGNPKKKEAEHGRISTIREDYLVSEIIRV